MALMTPQEYIDSLRKLNTRVYMFGEKIENWVDHPMIRPSINCVAMTYALAQDPQYADLMTVKSSLTGHTINRFTHLHQSTEDLINKVKMQRLLGQKTASCFQRCVGMDAFNAVFSTTYEIDEKYGTRYHENFKKFLTFVQDNDLTVDGAMTDPKGDRSKAPSQQADPDMYVHVVERRPDGIVTVTDDEIAAAVLALMERQKLVTEGAGAVSVAAAMYNKVDIKGKKTVCLLSGGNIDVNILSRVITRGLVMAGRNSTLTIELEDKPGQLSGVSDIISRCGGNVVSVHHNQSDTNMAITSCYLRVGMETRDHAQVEQIKQELAKAGFKLVANQQ